MEEIKITTAPEETGTVEIHSTPKWYQGVSLEAFSYTHLDVYKRQVYESDQPGYELIFA